MSAMSRCPGVSAPRGSAGGGQKGRRAEEETLALLVQQRAEVGGETGGFSEMGGAARGERDGTLGGKGKVPV